MKKYVVFFLSIFTLSCNPDEVLEAGLKVPEINVRTVQIQVDHSAKTICVSAVIRNEGGSDISGPFRVAIGITRFTNLALNHFIFSEEIIEVPAGTTIPAAGGEYTTEACSSRELVYRDLDPNAVYQFDILADTDNVLIEFDDWGNNRFTTDWWTYSPEIRIPFKFSYEYSGREIPIPD